MYPPQKFSAHLSARVTVQLGPQLLDIQTCVTSHSRRMSLLYCSLTGTASNWYDCLTYVYNNEWSSSLPVFENNCILKHMHTMLNLYHSLLSKKILKMLDIVRKS